MIPAGRRHGVASIVLVALAVTACAGGDPLTLPEPTSQPSLEAAEDGSVTPAGTVAVAYPDVPAAWHDSFGDDLAATDLAALWGLPLYRYGPDGVLRPALATGATVIADAEGSWSVEIALRSGTWSDGSAVTSDDVVATLEQMRSGPREAEFAVIEQVEAVGEHTVRLDFAAPYHRWPDLLAGGPGVLPAHVLQEQGIGAFADTIPVAGGWYRLDSYEPGLSARFVAHTDGPLGAPGLEVIEVLFTPRYETALGLLDDGRVDAVAGHVALNPVGRANRLGEGVESVAAVGGTMVALEWSPDVDTDVREAVAAVVDVSQLTEGLLGADATVATSPWPRVGGPWRAEGRSRPATRQIGTIRLLLPRWHEVPGFTSRAIQRDLAVLAGSLEIVSLESPQFVEAARDGADVVLRIRRTGPRPALAGLADVVTSSIRAADASFLRESDQVAGGFDELRAQAALRPLYRPAVAHAWRTGFDGIRPSAWPGVIFWNAGEWRLNSR
ncbi:MAG: ABC transporter substrate-binding protein [Nitriliruptorales bacterium]|nr:ABC transporter substrate-binding protein [Nitriliruptorales bacterium]